MFSYDHPAVAEAGYPDELCFSKLHFYMIFNPDN